MGPRLAAQGTLTRSAGDLDLRRHRFELRSLGAASRGPIWRRESRSLGTKLKPQKIEFGAFIGPSGQNQLYHTPLLLKIKDLTKNKKIVNNPVNAIRHT